MSNLLMEGKRGLIMGLANDKSIAWGIAQALNSQGAQLVISYQNDVMEKRVKPLALQLDKEPLLLQCDVTSSISMEKCFATIEQKWGKLDFLVHAIAFSDKNQLRGRTIDTTRDNFAMTLDISCFSFLEACKLASPLMKDGGSILTMTYMGSEKYLPNYNVMGIAKAALEAAVRYAAFDLGEQKVRVNAISAGPIKTLAASGIGDFRKMLHWNELNSALESNVTPEEVGQAALGLLSDCGKAITAEIIHVDCGYHAQGMIKMKHAARNAEVLKEGIE